MEIQDPRIDVSSLPAGSKAVVIAEHQKEYADLPSIRTPGGQVITRWQLTPAERAAIVRGEDLFITILSRGAINPILPSVGQLDWLQFEESIKL